MKFDEGGQLAKEGTILLGRISFTGCKVELNSKPAGGCRAHSTGLPVGTILTLKFKGLITLDEVGGVKEDYVKFVPDEGTAFVKLEMGEECSIGELVKVEGILWIKDCKGNGSSTTAGFLHEEVTHLIEESLHLLTALGRPAVIEGSAVLQLPLSGGTRPLWSGTPG